MSENEIKLLLALTSNIRIGVLMLDRANDLKETELCLKYPENQHLIQDEEYQELKNEMLKGTRPYTIKQFEENRKKKQMDRYQKNINLFLCQWNIGKN